jgi:hypothetical protein
VILTLTLTLRRTLDDRQDTLRTSIINPDLSLSQSDGDSQFDSSYNPDPKNVPKNIFGQNIFRRMSSKSEKSDRSEMSEKSEKSKKSEKGEREREKDSINTLEIALTDSWMLSSSASGDSFDYQDDLDEMIRLGLWLELGLVLGSGYPYPQIF